MTLIDMNSEKETVLSQVPLDQIPKGGCKSGRFWKAEKDR